MRKSQKVTGSLLFSGILLAMQPVAAQSQAVANLSEPGARAAILNEVVRAVTIDHYSPKPIDDNYAAGIYSNFMQQLDPAHTIFLKQDIDRLQKLKSGIDDQLKQGSAAFFDSAISIYKSRLADFKLLVPQLLSKPLDLTTTEVLSSDTKNQPYPSGITGRNAAWTKLLKLQVLKKYVLLLQQQKDQQKLYPALEAKAREVVKKTALAWAGNALTDRAIDDKFCKYVDCVSKQMDAHSQYMAPGLFKTFAGADGNPYFSIGVTLTTEDNEVYVKSVVPGTGTEAGKKINAGNRIIAIEDSTGTMTPVSGLNTQDATFLLSGKRGTAARLIIENEALEEVTISIPREEMKYTSYKAKSALITHNGKKIGLINLPNFYGGPFSAVNAANDVAKELKNLKALEAEMIIFDLRNNPGGSLTDGTSIGGYFFGEGPVAKTKAKYLPETHSASKQHLMFEGPLTVMVDESSASASEMFSAAVQDRGRGIVIGTSSTFGKGTAQNSISIPDPNHTKGSPSADFGSMTLTQKKFYRISGGTTQIGGVIPDIVMQDRMSNTSIREKDLLNVLPIETIEVKDFKPGKRNFNYGLVVKNAQQRIKLNKAMQLIGIEMKKEQQLLSGPVNLNWKSYVTRSKELAQLKASISKNKKLGDGQLLQVESGIPEWVNPNTIHPFEMLEYEAWLNSLKYDIYLQEAISVSEDILANPM
ncbi:hypothetical protein HHL16_10105 [Pseudoflavitalea sp. G-6-1-2]|uniref:S41 family peptidase n=1 Tax=Pseudoflavitalea sp. G-6-1-2 TaxID=2728841 RepID=UPI00146E08A3|nr:S41 family peptidase [Pseudoflavitalea sp. G-6-1-2]NML21226.1 hypothetical protein [Pseudoflavitalea sp. G-6-1-2]